MARIPMVTRTIKSTKVKALCVDIEKNETFTQEYVVPRTYEDHKSLMKVLEKVATTPTTKPVHILETSVEENLYGMPETMFITLASPITKEATEETEETTVEKNK